MNDKGQHLTDVDICGIRIRAINSEDSGNPHAHNVNIVGRDFIDTCKIIDNKKAQTLILELGEEHRKCQAPSSQE